MSSNADAFELRLYAKLGCFKTSDGKMIINVREVRGIRIVLDRRLEVLERKTVHLLRIPREATLVVQLRILGRFLS